MPAVLAALLLVEAVAVELLGLLGRDDADVVVLAAEAPPAVDDGVDVQLGGAGLAGELAEALGQGLLELVVQVVLLAEEDDAATGD